MPRLIALALILTLAAAASAAPVTDPPAQRRALVRNRALWARQNLHDYTFRLSVSCFCPPSARVFTITVRHGRPSGNAAFAGVRTIPQMFATIRHELLDPAAGATTVSYDARRGFPRRASLDPIRNAVDDELGWTIDRFRPLPAG